MPKRKGPTPPQEWTPFERATSARDRNTGEERPLHPGIELWANNLYVVHKYTHMATYEDGTPADLPPIIQLSIARRDRKTVRDWRHLQRIKNELIGPNYEAVDLFPAEERLVDTSNQYHLWAFDRDGYRFPFGFTRRLVMEPDEVQKDELGAVQRPFEVPPANTTTAEEIREDVARLRGVT